RVGERRRRPRAGAGTPAWCWWAEPGSATFVNDRRGCSVHEACAGARPEPAPPPDRPQRRVSTRGGGHAHEREQAPLCGRRLFDWEGPTVLGTSASAAATERTGDAEEHQRAEHATRRGLGAAATAVVVAGLTAAVRVGVTVGLTTVGRGVGRGDGRIGRAGRVAVAGVATRGRGARRARTTRVVDRAGAVVGAGVGRAAGDPVGGVGRRVGGTRRAVAAR